MHLLSVGTDSLREQEELGVLLMAFKVTLGTYLVGLYFDCFQFLAHFCVLFFFLFDLGELSLEGFIRVESLRDFD
jgi:hypothetical protein